MKNDNGLVDINLIERIKLCRGILTREIAYAGPFYVTIDVTNRCNLACLGCRYHSFLINPPASSDQFKMDISFNLIEKLFDELSKMGSIMITFQGSGEPMLHPRLKDMISKAKALGFYVMLITNGTLLDEKQILSLIESRLDIIRVSLWGSSIEEYKRNCPENNPEYFKIILNGLKLLSVLKKEKGSKFPLVHLHQPINKNNFQNIDAMAELAHKNGCDALSFSPFISHKGTFDSYRLSTEEEKHLCSTLREMIKKLSSLSIKHNIHETLLRYRIGEAVWEKLPCYIGWFHSRIKVDGTVIPCGPYTKPLGHLKDNSFQEIWNGSSYRAFRKQAMTKKGLASLTNICDCGFCCYAGANNRVQRFFRFLSPFITK